MADSTTTDQVEHELISTSLDLEQLDTNLFRSKSLWVPARARGVFGGQVISQAIVSATQCVDPAYGLHVRIVLCLHIASLEIANYIHPVASCELSSFMLSEGLF